MESDPHVGGGVLKLWCGKGLLPGTQFGEIPDGGALGQTIIAIEQGRYSPTLEMAFRIARVFRVPLDEVFQYADDQG